MKDLDRYKLKAELLYSDEAPFPVKRLEPDNYADVEKHYFNSKADKVTSSIISGMLDHRTPEIQLPNRTILGGEVETKMTNTPISGQQLVNMYRFSGAFRMFLLVLDHNENTIELYRVRRKDWNNK